MSIAVALCRMFPVRWQLARAHRVPSGDPREPYPIRWTSGPPPEGEGWDSESFDERGVLLVSGHYNPVDIAQYALLCYERWMDGHAASRSPFFAQAAYLRDRQRADGAYPYDIAVPEFSATHGWLSAMAQGEAASVLVRAHLASGDDRYANAAVRAIAPLRSDVKYGGASFIEGDAVFFEEVSVDPPCHILNGHLFAAFGVWELERAGLADRELITLHERAVETLLRWLPLFEDRSWTFYDLAVDQMGRRHLAPLGYHHFHIAQLEVYAAMTGEPVFERTARRWKAAISDPSARLRVWSYGAYWLLGAMKRKARLGAPLLWQPAPITSQAAR